MSAFWALIAMTLLIAVADWWAVATDRRPVEYVLKPATMVALIAAAVALADPTPSAARPLIVVGLICSLAGDVFLMLDERLFLGGLASFLAGHVAYVFALTRFELTPALLIVGVVLVGMSAALIGWPIVRGAAEKDRRLTGPVALYIAVISLMVVMALGTGVLAAIVGALLFYASDGLLGWNRFVGPIPNGRVGVMTTYHLGQVGLVLALVG